jgi:DNA-binding NarL/FixJ family response regulator
LELVFNPQQPRKQPCKEILMDRKIKVLIVDDQRRSRQSLRALLATWPAAAAIREAPNGVEALRLAVEFRPDLVLIDVRIPEMGGLETTQRLKERWPEMRVVVLSMYADIEPCARAAGADAFVTKGEPPEVLLRVLEGVTV